MILALVFSECRCVYLRSISTGKNRSNGRDVLEEIEKWKRCLGRNRKCKTSVPLINPSNIK